MACLLLGLPAFRVLRKLLGPRLSVWLLPAATSRLGGQALYLKLAAEEEATLPDKVSYLVASLAESIGDYWVRWTAALLKSTACREVVRHPAAVGMIRRTLLKSFAVNGH